MSAPVTSPLADALLAHRAAFKAFVTARVGNPADADDILQHGLAKALQHAGELRDDEKLVPWFYGVLRHAIVDHQRSRAAARARESAWTRDTLALADDPAHRALCRCFEALLPSLPSRQAALLRAVELEGQPVAAAAAALGLTANHASVTLHRARATLRQSLTAFCRDCAATACLDCDCPPSANRNQP